MPQRVFPIMLFAAVTYFMIGTRCYTLSIDISLFCAVSSIVCYQDKKIMLLYWFVFCFFVHLPICPSVSGTSQKIVDEFL